MSRKAFKPTSEMCKTVHSLSALGMPQEDIARVLQCSPKTLRKHFRRELTIGTTEADAAVVGFLYEAALAGNVTAQIFWAKHKVPSFRPRLAGEPIEPPEKEPVGGTMVILPAKEGPQLEDKEEQAKLNFKPNVGDDVLTALLEKAMDKARARVVAQWEKTHKPETGEPQTKTKG